MEIQKLQYITQENQGFTHLHCVAEACIFGVKWIQLRVKDKTLAEYLNIAKEAKTICDLYDVKLIINDNVEVAIQVDADGVHLGKSDLDPKEARKLLGNNKIIGGTANTIEDIERLINQGVNYIGLGPYKATKTKDNLSPILGNDGYYEISQKVFETLRDGKLNNKIPPIIAVGGIDVEDVESLMQTGIDGIAVSGALTKDFSKIKEFNKLIEQPIVDVY